MFHPTMSKSGRFFFAPVIKSCEYLGKHYPKLLLKLRYRYAFKKSLNLKCPRDLNEKILWAKLYSDTSRWVELADKRRVRDYVEEKGLGDILVKLYATWYKKEDVNLDELPERFIIKANNGDGKGTNKIIDKSRITAQEKDKLLRIVDEWLHRKNIGALSAEPQYAKMTPCVVVEEVLPIEKGAKSLVDYKMWCFNGECACIIVYNDRNEGGNSAKVLVYDRDWSAHPEYSLFSSDYPQGSVMSRPKNLERMIEVAEQLSEGFPEVRVDLYNIDGKIYFGELTFTAQGGFLNNFTPEFNKSLGDKFSIEDFPKKK